MQDVLRAILANEQRFFQDHDGGLYVGLGGVGYALWYISKILNNQDLAGKAEQYLATNAEYYNKARLRAGDRVGFLLGSSGISAVQAIVAKSSGKDPRKYLADFGRHVGELLQPDPLGCGSDEVLVGRAGYILGALWIKQAIQMDGVPIPQLYQLCDAMLQSGRNYAQKVKSPSPLMYQYYKTEYLGAAHGVAGILQAFLSVPGYFEHNPNAETEVKAAVDFYLSLQNEEGNFPCAMDELGQSRRHPDDDLVHWCHGAPGAVYMLARAYLVWKEEKYLHSLMKAGECVWKKGLLKKGPGVCHGIAGSGYVFLLLYRITGDNNQLYRAEKFGEFLFSEEFREARTPDCPFSLYEGWAGTACYLADLASPQQSAFPFSDVFL